MTQHRRAALAATTAILSQAAIAAPVTAQQAFALDPIVVSPSLTPVEADRSGAVVERLDGREVEASDTALVDRLDRLPGVNTVSNGGLGALSTVQLRGLPARYVGVRVNGIDVSDPSGTQNQFDFGGLTGAGLGRIEVLKGSQSALFGSEAIGGVIDITSWRPQENGFSGAARGEAGRYATLSGSLNLGHRTDRGLIALTYSHVESDGFSASASDGEDDGFDQDMFTFYGEADLGEAVTVGGTFLYRDSEVDIDPFAGTRGRNLKEEQGGRAFARLVTGAVTHEVSVSLFDIDRRDTSPGAFTPRFTGERHEVAYLGSATLGARTTLNFGLEHTEEEFTALPTRGDKDNTAVNAELLFAPADDIDISAALRNDDDSDFGNKLTGRLAAVWRPAQGWALRAMAGTGFRAPSLFERFSGFGDPDLQPEDSESYELGVERSFTRGTLKATLFYIEIDDLIDFDPGATACGSGFGCFGQVPGTTTSKGVELSGDYAVTDDLTLFANYTYTRARNDGQQLARTPEHDGVVGLKAQLSPKWRGSVDVRHVADVRPSAFAPPDNKVGDYTLVGARVAHQLTDDVEAYLRVENLFDEDFETVGGFNTAGRSAFAGIRGTF